MELEKWRTNSKGEYASRPCCDTRTRLSRKLNDSAFLDPSDAIKLRARDPKLRKTENP